MHRTEITAADIRGLVEDIAGLTAICVLFVAGLGLPFWF